MNKKLSSFYINKIAWLSAGAIFFIADRLFKLLALNLPNGFNQKILGDILIFNFIPNYNIAFSLPLSGLWLNILISLIIVILILYTAKAKGFEKSALYLIIIGAVSNIIDRWRYGYVIDYLDLKWFTVFNLADVLICLGTLILMISLFKKTRD